MTELRDFVLDKGIQREVKRVHHIPIVKILVVHVLNPSVVDHSYKFIRILAIGTQLVQSTESVEPLETVIVEIFADFAKIVGRFADIVAPAEKSLVRDFAI